MPLTDYDGAKGPWNNITFPCKNKNLNIIYLERLNSVASDKSIVFMSAGESCRSDLTSTKSGHILTNRDHSFRQWGLMTQLWQLDRRWHCQTEKMKVIMRAIHLQSALLRKRWVSLARKCHFGISVMKTFFFLKFMQLFAHTVNSVQFTAYVYV